MLYSERETMHRLQQAVNSVKTWSSNCTDCLLLRRRHLLQSTNKEIYILQYIMWIDIKQNLQLFVYKYIKHKEYQFQNMTSWHVQSIEINTIFSMFNVGYWKCHSFKYRRLILDITHFLPLFHSNKSSWSTS